MTTIYGLIDPRNDFLRYVGKTTNLSLRLKNHCYPSHVTVSKNRKNSWLLSLLSQGLEPDCIVLEEVEDEEWEEAEVFWISYMSMVGCELLNHTKGGKGSPGLIPSSESREARRIKMLGTHWSQERRDARKATIPRGENHYLYGTTHTVSEETRRKISESRKGDKHYNYGGMLLPIQREALRKANTGVVFSEERRAKISKANKGRKWSEEQRTNHASNVKRGKDSPMYGRKMNPEGVAVRAEKISHDWRITTPEGQVIEIRNLKAFCVENELQVTSMWKVSKGQRRHHKGWKCENTTNKPLDKPSDEMLKKHDEDHR